VGYDEVLLMMIVYVLFLLFLFRKAPRGSVIDNLFFDESTLRSSYKLF